jgi:cell wall-associated NlpC family hydrolase
MFKMNYIKGLYKLILLVGIAAMMLSINISAAEIAPELLAAASNKSATPTKNASSDIYAVISATPSVALKADSKDSAYSVVALPTNYALTVLGAEYGWVFVQDDNGNKGYVKGTDITFKNGTKPSNSSVLLAKRGTDLVNFAKKYLGTPYVWGGTNLNTGVDCSGFVYCVYRNFGITLNRSSSSMYTQGTAVNKANLIAGDLVFFSSEGSVDHVGIYIGDNQYIHSSTYGVGVIISSLNTPNAQKTYTGAKRIFTY